MTAISPDILYRIALNLIPGVGSVMSKQLISYCGSAKTVFATPKGKLHKIPGVGEKLASAITSSNLLSKAEQELNLAEKHDVKIISYDHPEYPEKLKHIADSPSVLYLKGSINNNIPHILGIVGTRNASHYGKKVTEVLVGEIASSGLELCVVSGLAYGIDYVAHSACVYHQVPTVGVMGNGIDKIYPAVHKDLVKKISQEQGALLTEYSFGTKADAHNFPARNRIVAGMCDAIIVVEAAIKGGALITADLAVGYDRDVFAVPGNVGSTYSEGCNALIRDQKAQIFTDVNSLFKAMNWSKEAVIENNKTKGKNINYENMPDEWATVLKHFLTQKSDLMIDDMSWQLGIPINRMASILLELEFEGHIKALPGKKFRLM